MQIQFLGATREVTGSCYLLQVGNARFLVECGMLQGSRSHEEHNRDPFTFDPETIDAVVLTHAHLDHSGRLPLLLKRGFNGPIYTHSATTDLCRIMLEDSGYLNENEAHWENKKRERKGLKLVEPLYTRADAKQTEKHFRSIEYGKTEEILPGVRLTLRDAGHILGSAIAELELTEGGRSRKVVFSGDLGHRGAPILRDPERVSHADLVVLESTYGDRMHRPWEQTWSEMGQVISHARSHKGNVLIPSFAVGRTQELLYVLKRNHDEWGIDDWQVYVDSPMAIEATEVYSTHSKVYDRRAREIYQRGDNPFHFANLHMSETAAESMRLNEIRSGAIIIAGSGMCTGGRIKHHLKHNIWRQDAHVMIVGFQARGTLGRSLVDGTHHIRLWGEAIQVRAHVHTIGGLSAHADRQGLLDWYAHFEDRPPVVLVHGEPEAMDSLGTRIKSQFGTKVTMAEFKQTVEL